MNINVIAVGKIRENYIKQGVEEFLKRIQPYSQIKTIEITAEMLKDEGNEHKAREAEAQKILGHLNANSYVIVLDIKGQKQDSVKFAKQLQEINMQGYNQLNFVIGGATGLDKSIIQRANLLISLSDMTFPHQIARFILLEQIYRAFRIINNEPYHK